MRIGFAAAALLAMASSASAASLSGSPFAIDALTSRQEIRHSLFETRKGGFGVVMARDDGQTGFPDSTYLRLFDKKGKPLGKTFFVGRSKPAPGPSAGTFPAGALQLAGGKILVSYADHRMNTIYSWGGLFAQTVARGAPEGTERRVDTSESGTFEAGGLIGLSAGRGLAYWRISNSQTRQVEAYGRFVTKLNELDPIIFDFSREGRVLVDAAPYRSGFMLKQAASDETSGTASVFFQLYDSLGTPSGKEFRALDGGKIGEVPFVSAVGLPNGSIVVLRSLKSKGGAELTAQLHAAKLEAEGQAQGDRQGSRPARLHGARAPQRRLSRRRDGSGRGERDRAEVYALRAFAEAEGRAGADFERRRRRAAALADADAGSGDRRRGGSVYGPRQGPRRAASSALKRRPWVRHTRSFGRSFRSPRKPD
ncbi:hypothetical protein [Chenggangzhangella methanolivorans]|uniref:Phytase-like domain-containing protein n=1 Tax=Chenggangzhangella methanolivorans TaxID=1437009 RepID=A0A9E6UQE5_9HYPH|nr:hypothetical protein [Chenggangzhangella methanolivorans]QZO00845.1 hypothetical protein K6K41_04080 [Chenggangzhangella methanolivorans]